MKTKKKTRLISLFLAVVMAVSALTASISAQAAYKPAYGEKATEEQVAYMIEDINTILDGAVLTGDTIEELYKVLPALSVILMVGSNNSSTVAFYTELQPEKFANLADYSDDGTSVVDDVVAEDGTVTTPGTLTRFFEENPIVCESAADFQTELNAWIDTLCVENVITTLRFALLMGGGAELAAGLDEVCEALGIEQENPASYGLGIENGADGTPYMSDSAAAAEVLSGYLKNIVGAILPDVANNVLDIVRTVVADENAAKLYSGVSRILSSLGNVLTWVGNLGLGDFTSIIDTVNQINGVWTALPTTGEDTAKMLDVNALVPWLLETYAGGVVTLDLAEIDLSKLIDTETNADLVKTVYDYLYANLIENEDNKAVVQSLFTLHILENLLNVEIPDETETAILNAMEMSNDDLAYYGISEIATLAGRDLTPDEPTTDEPTTGEPTTEEPTTTTPGAEDPTDTKEPTTKPADQNKPANAANPNLPNTGKTSDYVTAASAVAALCAGMALVCVLLRAKKKVTD